jgi:hypothetical protein
MHRRGRSVRRLAGLLVAGALLAAGHVTAGGPANGMSLCSGPNPPASCDPADPPSRENNPTGSLTTASRQPTGLNVTGTAQDPDTDAALQVVITVDGTSIGTLTTNAATGAFSGTLPARAGTRVCAKAVNKGPGADTVVGCLTYTVGFDPYGSLDSISAIPGGIRVQGWAIDPDTATPISVQVQRDDSRYPNTLYVTTVTASGDRPDVAAAHPGYGAPHGYDVTVPATSGSHSVCVSAINTSAGTSNTLLGCRTVTEPGPPTPRVFAHASPTATNAFVLVGITGSAATTYTLQRAVGSASAAWSTVLTTGSAPSSWYDRDVVPGGTYCYRASASDGYGTSDFSEPTCATMPSAP